MIRLWTRTFHFNFQNISSHGELITRACQSSKFLKPSKSDPEYLTSIKPVLVECRRYQSSVPSSSSLEEKLREKYGARLGGWDPRNSNNGQPLVIYEGILSKQIRSLKLFSFLTTAMGLSLQAALFEKLQGSSMAATVSVFSIVGFFTFVTPVLIHLVAKRYVTELIYDPAADVYTAATYSFFLQRKELKFKVENVVVPTVPGLFTTIIVKSSAKGSPLFLVDSCFHELNHFGRLMGYDKPIDFGITASDIEAAKERKKEVVAKSDVQKS